MDSRTRVIHALTRKSLDRIPRSESLWEDTETLWRTQGLGNRDVIEVLGGDIDTMSLDLSMRRPQILLKQDGQFITVQDRFGYTVRKFLGKSRSMEFSDHFTKDKTVWQQVKPRFRFNPDDTARLDDKSYFLHMDEYPSWTEVTKKYEKIRQNNRYLLFVAYGPWEAAWRHRGYEPLLMDLLLDPDWVRDMAQTHIDLLLDCLTHCLKLGMKPDGLYLVDDLACTRGLLFSPHTWREIYKPLFLQLGKFLHKQDITFWLHSCGNVEALIPDFLDCGLDVLQPLQAHSGMDVRSLKPLYGDRLTFWGNIDAAKMSGPADELEAEIRDKLTVAKQGGGYIFHSDHSVPPEVSFERYLWILQLVEKYGTY